MKTSGILAAVSAVILILSLGMCGFSLKYSSNQDTGVYVVLSLIGMAVGGIGLLIAGILAIVHASRTPSIRNPPPPRQPPPPPPNTGASR